MIDGIVWGCQLSAERCVLSRNCDVHIYVELLSFEANVNCHEVRRGSSTHLSPDSLKKFFIQEKLGTKYF